MYIKWLSSNFQALQWYGAIGVHKIVTLLETQPAGRCAAISLPLVEQKVHDNELIVGPSYIENC